MRHKLLFCIISVLMVGADVAATGRVRTGDITSVRREMACAEHTRPEAVERSAKDDVRHAVTAGDEDAITVYSRYSVACLSERHSSAYCLYRRRPDGGAERAAVHFYNTGENRLRVAAEDGIPH